MKRLNLDTLNQNATLTAHLINKARLDLGGTYNAVSMGMANAIPIQLIFRKVQIDYPELYANAESLKGILAKLTQHTEESAFAEERETVDNIIQSLDALDEGAIPEENLTAFVSKTLMLLGLMFADLQKLADGFVDSCRKHQIQLLPMMDWVEDDPLDLTVEEEVPSL